MIEARNLHYTPTFPSVPILNGIDFTAEKGEFVGIVGPNGAGKTTLLKALAGLLPVHGDRTIDDKPLRSYSVRQLARQVAFMHQDTMVAFDFTVAEVVALGRYPWTMPMVDEAVKEAMAMAGCTALADRGVTALSGGERQRVMLARALAQTTPALLLDEPTSGLDIGYSVQVFSLCRTLAAQGKCVVAVMHDLRMAAKDCTRLCLLHEGRVLADGVPEEVLTKETLRTAYGVETELYRNPAGEWDFFVHPQEKTHPLF